ncbi:MAG: hypothetical protein Q9160_008109 [Pyrenula sp. 1 TL-2023]
MSRKRGNSSSPDIAVQQPIKKRRPSPALEQLSDAEENFVRKANRSNQQPKIDPRYGQKNAFPGLDDDDEASLLYGGDPADGIEYLRMVRSEAKGVPHLLLAPQSAQPTSIYKDSGDDGTLQNGGYYYDGAYTAAPTGHAAVTSLSGRPKAQEAYYESLFLRFNLIRATLKCAPPLSAIEALTSSQPISFPSNAKKAYSEWRSLVNKAEPNMTQMACMDSESLLTLLKLLTKLIPPIVRSRNVDKIRRLGAWAWASLGKCREVGELGSEEVSELREFGKIAAGALYGFKDRSGVVYGDEEEDADDLVSQNEERQDTPSVVENEAYQMQTNQDNMKDEGVPEDLDEGGPTLKEDLEKGGAMAAARSPGTTEDQALKEAKQRLEAQVYRAEEEDEDGHLSETSDIEDESGLDFEKRARAALDMILTIVGELYGQRDLLELRDEWAIES